jgi:HK97 family phage prohead protease
VELKHFSGPLKAKSGGFSAVISTPQVDSDGESVDPLGLINRDEYMTNPLVFWAHEWAYNPAAEPIAKASDLRVSPKNIMADADWAPTAKAQNVRTLVDGGFVSRTSVGFDSLGMEMRQGVPTHVRWALREFSIVPMPANTGAMITGVKSALAWLADNFDPGTLADVGLELHSPEYGIVTVHDGRHEIAKATWSTAYVDALPDSAFACVQGKQRYYPHHSAGGALDLPHLRAALSRIGDPSNQQCGKAHLEAHAKAAGIGQKAITKAADDVAAGSQILAGLAALIEEEAGEGDDTALLMHAAGDVHTWLGTELAEPALDADDANETGDDTGSDYGMEEQQEAAPRSRRITFTRKERP